MRKVFTSLFISVFFASIGFARPSDEIKTTCGGRARVVWCQDAGQGTDAGAQGNSLRLMGFDTDDGRGERCILTNLSNYAKPMLAPDGNKIIFSNRQEQKIYVVGFDGSGLKAIASGFALAVWRDSLTVTDWIYAGTVINQEDAVIADIRRFRLDKPEVSESVWSKTPLNLDNFQLSADGRYASGQFPWPACGVAELPNREWAKYGDGCWPSLSPDNERLFWIFDGAHRNLSMFRTKTDERWVVNINHAPGIDGFEIYHPRWSNHSLFMVITGPYKMGAGDNRIRGGGKDVEIYLGKFAPDFKKIERWIKVTYNEYADFFPDFWISAPNETAEPPAGNLAAADSIAGREALGLPVKSGLPEKKKASVDAWPVSYDGLVFFWQNRSKANTFTDPLTQIAYIGRVGAKGRARYGRHFEMAPAGGAFIAEGGADELKKKVMASQQLAVEVMITPDRNSRGELLPIVGHTAHSGGWNFLLGQQGRRLVFQIKAGGNQPHHVISLGALVGDEPSHIIISCLASSVTGYLNGEQVVYHDSIWVGPWEEGEIVFGNEWREKYPVNMENEKTGWHGLIENVALYSRWIGREEARKKYKASAEKIHNRRPIPGLSVKAKLISRPVIPLPESIAPYRRALLVSHYLMQKGACPDREIMAAQWAILDAQSLDSAQRRQGKTYQLTLEPFSDHPELEGERLIMDSDRFDLPLYYEVGD